MWRVTERHVYFGKVRVMVKRSESYLTLVALVLSRVGLRAAGAPLRAPQRRPADASGSRPGRLRRRRSHRPATKGTPITLGRGLT